MVTVTVSGEANPIAQELRFLFTDHRRMIVSDLLYTDQGILKMIKIFAEMIYISDNYGTRFPLLWNNPGTSDSRSFFCPSLFRITLGKFWKLKLWSDGNRDFLSRACRHWLCICISNCVSSVRSRSMRKINKSLVELGSIYKGHPHWGEGGLSKRRRTVWEIAWI